ncbi:MAG: Rieske 2Fe-2S domain-containing protein [Oligoflexales bacterium]
MNLRERDQRLQENWYIACQSFRLKKNKPLKSKIYDQNLVIFRNQNNVASCLLDRCLHRHSPLSAGRISSGQIECPYHGWCFNDRGELTKIPSEKNSCTRFRKKIKHFPVIEQDGLIWIWMGDDEKPYKKPWKFPEKKGWHSYIMETNFENEVTHLAENFMDVPHTGFVHKGWFRNVSNQKCDMTVRATNGEVWVDYKQDKDKIGFIDKLLNPTGADSVHTDHFFMPNITKVDYLFGAHRGFSIISQCTPESTLQSKVFTQISYRLFPGIDAVFKPFLNWYTRQVINQDVEIMKLQGKNIDDLSRPKFTGGQADQIHREIEKLRIQGINDPDTVPTSSENIVSIWI